MKSSLIVSILITTFFTTSQASVIVTHESHVISKIAEELSLGEIQATSWEELEKERAEPIDQTFPKISPTKRYAFLANPLKLTPPLDGELYIIARRPFPSTAELQPDYKSLGRYIIYRQGEKIKSQWIKEEYIQVLFKDHISILPTPDNEPLRPEEIEAKYGRHATTIGYATLFALVLIGPIIFFFTDRLSRKIKSTATSL